MSVTAPIECDLAYSRKALVRQGAGWVVDQERKKSLPLAPASFVSVRGPYGQIAKHATKLNELQQKSGFWDFIFHPEPAPLESAK